MTTEWLTVTTFSDPDKKIPINFFVRVNEDGTETIFDDELDELNEEDKKQFYIRQTGRGDPEPGFISEEGFEKAIQDIKNVGRLDIYDVFPWSYSTSTSGMDLIARYLYNLSLPVKFMKLLFNNPEDEWYDKDRKNILKQDFDNDDNANNIIYLYYKIPDDKKKIKLEDNKENRELLKFIINKRININNNSGARKILQGTLFKEVACINWHCPNKATPGPVTASAKMRQECSKCTDRKDDSAIIMGYSSELKNKILTLTKEPIIFVCPRYCKNSEFNVDTKTWKITKKENPKPISWKNEKDPNNITSGRLMDQFGDPFFCPISADKYRTLRSGAFQIDHKNGNHWDNSWKNVQSLCSICHDTKSSLSGDKASKAKKKGKESSDTITTIIDNEINQFLAPRKKKVVIEIKNDEDEGDEGDEDEVGEYDEEKVYGMYNLLLLRPFIERMSVKYKKFCKAHGIIKFWEDLYNIDKNPELVIAKKIKREKKEAEIAAKMAKKLAKNQPSKKEPKKRVYTKKSDVKEDEPIPQPKPKPAAADDKEIDALIIKVSKTATSRPELEKIAIEVGIKNPGKDKFANKPLLSAAIIKKLEARKNIDVIQS